MSTLNLVRTGVKNRPHFICLYGVGGVGKSTFAASAPKPIFIGSDDGVGAMNVTDLPPPESWPKFLSYLNDLLHEKHDFETLVVDTVTGLEALLWQHLCMEAKVASIEDIDNGFGRGYLQAVGQWNAVMATLKRIRAKMNVILLGHARVKATEDPIHNERYDRYSLKMHPESAATIQEAVDCMFFATYLIETSKIKKAIKAKATGEGTRCIWTEERPAFIAKNRFDLPPRMDLSWDEFVTRAAARVTSASVDEMSSLFAGMEAEALAYLTGIKWLLPGQQLTDLMAAKRKAIMSRKDSFLAAVKEHAAEEAPTAHPTEEAQN